ncbi:MAG: cupredoxin domain-containing protein [Euryarchaeota archaeon]|nr:cupredoxin domain-containing protein [Euryarchaeota archaeon]
MPKSYSIKGGFKLNYKWIPGLLILMVLISGCTSSGPSTETQPVITAPPPVQTTVSLPMTANVENIDFSFYPAEVVIAKGGTVTWKQKDYDVHTVTGAGFDSGELSQGKTFSHTFNEVGTYEYMCKLHPSMKGKVVVK